MNNKENYIGISNRIPFTVIDEALDNYFLTGVIDKELCFLHIKEFTAGDNRAKKTLQHLVAVINRNEKIIKALSKIVKGKYLELSLVDRKVFTVCLFCNSFPIAYQILKAFSVGFKVQPLLSKQFLLQKIGAIYGGNRAMHIAVDEVTALLIECGLINREKVGVYSFGQKMLINSKFIKELIVYTDIKVSDSKSLLVDELDYKPWYLYFDTPELSKENFNILISKKESLVGKGYLTISSI